MSLHYNPTDLKDEAEGKDIICCNIVKGYIQHYTIGQNSMLH